MTYRKGLILAVGTPALAGIPLMTAWAAGDVVTKYDTDNDRTLSLDEVKAAASAHFDKLNKDGDSTLETKEVQGVIGAKAFKAADADNDGSLSKDEYLALVQKLFQRADADHDGTLTSAELHSKSGRALKRLID
jgi:Ca2+-binding EF-hand superfamily protein